MTIKDKREYIVNKYEKVRKTTMLRDWINSWDKTGKCWIIYINSYEHIYGNRLDSEMILFINLFYKLIKKENDNV